MRKCIISNQSVHPFVIYNFDPKVLAAVSSTASLERLFSVAGDMQNPRLRPKITQNLLLSKYNSKIQMNILKISFLISDSVSD